MKPGEMIGNYRIDAPIAGGGMGMVYRATNTRLGREVAIKVLLETFAHSEKVRHRFQQEAYVQAQLKHPNIVQVSDLVVEDENLALVMELIEGPSLETVLTEQKPGPWTLDEALALFKPILEAFAYAHERGIVHRDVKPGNILLAPGGGLGIPKVTDFGLAKILSDTSSMTKTGSKMGTMPYMAPEQFEGKKDISTGADVFALGILFWRLLAGHLPVEPDNMKACLLLYTGMEPMAKMASVRDDLPEGVQDFLDRACALEPSERFADAGELLKACEFGDAPVAAPPASVPAPPEPAPPEPAPVETQPAAQDTGVPSAEVARAQPAAGDAEAPGLKGASPSAQHGKPRAFRLPVFTKRESRLIVALTIVGAAMVVALIVGGYSMKRPNTNTTRQEADQQVEATKASHWKSTSTVAAGRSHTCGIKKDGGVSCWGGDYYGQSTPKPGRYIQLAAGAYHTCGLKKDGGVSCWGNNREGQSTPNAGSYIQLAAGAYHTCGIKKDGGVSCWGANEDLHGKQAGQSTPPAGVRLLVPSTVPEPVPAEEAHTARAPSGVVQRTLAAGGYHTCGLKKDSSVSCWGWDKYGQSTPKAGSYIQLVAGDVYTCGLKKDGGVRCWGNDDHGQSTPKPGSYIQLAAGRWHTCGIKKDGGVSCWGSNASGQSTPRAGSYIHLVAGRAHTCGLKKDGGVSCWGRNNEGQSTPPAGVRLKTW